MHAAYQGRPVWRERHEPRTAHLRVAAIEPEGPDAVSVYVTGQSQTSTAVQGAGGPSNSFLQVFSTAGKRVANTQIAVINRTRRTLLPAIKETTKHRQVDRE